MRSTKPPTHIQRERGSEGVVREGEREKTKIYMIKQYRHFCLHIFTAMVFTTIMN